MEEQTQEQTQNKKKINLKAVNKKVLIVILVLWIIFSVGYIGRDQGIRFLNQQILTAYQQGVSDAVRALMAEAELCRPTSLVDGERTMEVIKVGCPPAGQQPVIQPQF